MIEAMSNLKPLHTKKVLNWSLKETYSPFVIGTSHTMFEAGEPSTWITWLQGTVNLIKEKKQIAN